MCSLMEHSERSFREKMAELEQVDREESAGNGFEVTERPPHPVYIPEHMRDRVREIR